MAAAAGIGRTTLHKRYPKRDDLLLAVGHDAVTRMAGIAAADLPTSGPAEDAAAALRRLVEVLVPLGAQVNFLLRQPSIDADEERVSERGTIVAAVAVVGVGIAVFAFLPPVPVMLALGFAVGVAAGPINPVAAVIMQRRTPERLRGRVIGSYTSLALAAGPFGLLVMGPVVDAGGPGTGFAVIGVGCVLAAVFAGLTRGLRSPRSSQ